VQLQAGAIAPIFETSSGWVALVPVDITGSGATGTTGLQGASYGTTGTSTSQQGADVVCHKEPIA
jgi:hypothetical protein